MKRIVTPVMAMVISWAALAQTEIKGLVVDQKSESLVGATIREENTNNFVITDEQGFFMISLKDSESYILVDYVGFETGRIRAKDVPERIMLRSNYELEDIIISAVRAQDEPVTYSTVNKQQIAESYNGEQPIFILEELTPSIFSFSDAGTRLANGGNIRLRGIGQERINMTLNGIPLNDMIDHGVFFSNFTDIGNSIESMQVQRGVGMSSNGTSSYAGSINFETVNLSNREAEASAEVGIGSFNTKRFNVSASTGMIDDKWSAYTSVSRLYSDGFRRNTFTDAYSVFMSVGYFGEKDFFKVTAFDANSKNGLGYGGVLESDLRADPRTNYLNPNDEDDFGQQLVQLQHTHTFHENLDVTSSLYYGAAGGDFLFTYPLTDSTQEQINYPLYNDHYGLMSTLFWSPLKSLETTFGVHGYIFNRRNEEALAPDFHNPYYVEESTKREFSSFAKVAYQVEKIKFFADVQLRTQTLRFKSAYSLESLLPGGDLVKEWTFFNPKIGVNYEHNDELSLYASFGRTGREPTRLDIFGGAFSLSETNVAVAQSDDFKPEYVNDLEAGLKFSGDRLLLNSNLFYMDFQNEIAPYGEVGAFGSRKRTNIPDSYRRGVEVELAYVLTDQLDFSGHVTYMQSGIVEVADSATALTYKDVDPILSPEWIYGGRISYRPIKELRLGLSARGISKSYLEISNNEDLVLPSYAVLDFQLGVEISFVEINLEVNNLIGNNFYTTGNPVSGVTDQGAFLVNAGRNFFLTTRFSF